MRAEPSVERSLFGPAGLEAWSERERWVTIQNEPNTRPKKNPATGQLRTRKVTPERLDDMYRRLDNHLREKRLRQQIRFMTGDLIRVSPDDQKLWFEHMDRNLAGLLDAYSVHIYWDYFKTDKFEERLQEVLRFVTRLRNTKNKPIFITEYGVRGHRGPNRPAPGIFKDGTPAGRPLSQTNIAAFQQAWFLIRSMQLGYHGTIKWDCYFGTYDSSYRKKHYVIGPPASGEWALYPTYHLLRLVTLTTEEGWRVVHLKPKSPASTKRLVALKGPGTQLTILGLDSRGAKTNGVSQTKVSYIIDGLRRNAAFTLLLWNRAGGGQLASDGTITSNARGVASVTAPLHAVFALTTKSVSL
jgi:Glycosyl hydrolase catalytic core